MTANEYQKAALRTAQIKKYGPVNTLINCALGLTGESGEFADSMKKAAFQGHDLNKLHLEKELGDILWYVAVACEVLETDLETVMQKNVDKLLARYPNGFEPERSIYRVVENE